MIVKGIASGSKGNAYYISDAETRILIECGVAMKKLTSSPEFDFNSLHGILVSHRHGDHCKSLKHCKNAGASLYAPAEVFAFKGVDGDNCHPVKAFEGFTLGSFFVLPFDLNHDCVNYGYLLCSKATGERLLYFTDTYMVKYKFDHLTHIMAECNYSMKTLRENVRIGLVPAWLKDRIKVSHMSLEQLLKFMDENDLSKVRSIYLIHMSENNGSPAIFRHRIRKATGKHVEIIK